MVYNGKKTILSDNGVWIQQSNLKSHKKKQKKHRSLELTIPKISYPSDLAFHFTILFFYFQEIPLSFLSFSVHGMLYNSLSNTLVLINSLWMAQKTFHQTLVSLYNNQILSLQKNNKYRTLTLNNIKISFPFNTSSILFNYHHFLIPRNGIEIYFFFCSKYVILTHYYQICKQKWIQTDGFCLANTSHVFHLSKLMVKYVWLIERMKYLVIFLAFSKEQILLQSLKQLVDQK